MRTKRWTAYEERVLRRLYPVGGAEAVQEKVKRARTAIMQKAHMLEIPGPPKMPPALVTKLQGVNLTRALEWFDAKVPIEEIARRLRMGAPTVQNGVMIGLARRSGTAAERDPEGHLTPYGLEQLREALRQGWKGREIQERLGISASRVSRERKVYSAELRKTRKKALPPPGAGVPYCGVKVAPAKKREVARLFLEGFGTAKISEQTGVSKTVCLRVRAALVKRLRRKGQCLPGCDAKGVRRVIKESVHFVKSEQVEALRKLLLDRVPVQAAAKIVGMGASRAYVERDRLAGDLREQGKELPPPRRMGKKAYPVPEGTLQEAKAKIVETGGDPERARRIMLEERCLAEAKGDPALEAQIQKLLAGATLSRALPVRAAGPDQTLGGVTGEIM